MSKLLNFISFWCSALAMTFFALAGPPLLSAAGEDKPDLSGRWTRDPGTSQDWRVAMDRALAPETDSASDPNNRAWVARLVDLLRGGDEVSIRQGERELTIVSGDEVRIFYFDREHVRENPRGLRIKAFSRWDGRALVIEESTDDGSKVVERILSSPDGSQLVHLMRWESPKLRHPLAIRSVYERVENDSD